MWGLFGCTSLRSAQRAVVVSPADPAAWVDLGDAYKRRLKKKRAQEAYGRALSLEPGHPDASAAMSGMQRRTGSNKVVRMALRNPNDDELWGDAGDYYRSIGLHEEALSAYTYALQIDPTDGEWQRAIYTLAGIDHLLALVEERADVLGDEGLGDLGDILREQGETEQACALYRRANELDSSDDEWRQRIAECDGTTYNSETDSLGYTEGVPGSIISGIMGSGSSSDPTDVLRTRVFSNPELLRELGVAHAQAGDLAQARDYLHSALLLRPSDDTTLEMFVAVTGRTRRNVLEQLVEEVPDNDELLGELGDQMLSEGRPEEALLYYSRALEIDDDDPEWTQKQALIRTILEK